MTFRIRDILNSSTAFTENTSSSLAIQPPNLTFEPSPGASSCPQSPHTPTEPSGTAPGQAAPTKWPLEDGTTEDVRSQYPNPHAPIGVSAGPSSAISGPDRLPSQAFTALDGTQAPLSTLPTSHAPSRPQPPPAHPQVSRSANMHAARPLPSTPSGTASSWLETSLRYGLLRHGMEESHFGVQEQQAFMNIPGSNAPIPVRMDFSQASRKADEKRQRNAAASTRHRQKKRVMQEEISKHLQEYRNEKRAMETNIAKLTQERDFHREDRNRLLDIIAQTPSISGFAGGPPSPTFSMSNSYADTGSLVPGPSGFMGYGGDMRPTQRRRTDDHPEYQCCE
ncbi:hypothetical protein FLAG1_12062 [Fusarium langsethiae]|uniref:BZIP domain-containing protein n=1 Tax=Fusarium langsethiae TaxID=179993 RepID=A0A0M9EL22_FUSLA|nr:hypothetical protein FLAG1_12062 [Fusarium langsethiae]GKU09258.1 unnamed protein product [Fusarium langsethiae]GKU10121.1 unnamed protein product [Fusarium langsethiae]